MRFLPATSCIAWSIRGTPGRRRIRLDPPQARDLATDFTDHLAELRRRLLVSLTALVAGSAVGFIEAPRVLVALARPIGHLVFTSPPEALLAHLKVALVVGVVISSPLTSTEAWLFVSPGLRPEERRYVAMFVPAVASLFAIGVGFAYVAVYPLALRFFLSFVRADLTCAVSCGRFLSFFAAFVLPFGVAFQVPVVAYIVSRLGLLTPNALARGRKYVYVLTFVVAAVLTPPDVVSQVLMALPMLILFEVAVALSRVAWMRSDSRRQRVRGVNRGG